MTGPTHTRDPPVKSPNAARDKSPRPSQSFQPDLLGMVSALGNRGMERLARVQCKCVCPGTSPTCQSKDEPGELGIQPKLVMSQPDDPLEREADRMAEEVMRSEVPGSPAPAMVHDQAPPITGGLQATLSGANGDGRSLPAEVRTFFEPRFGHDFSHVRIYTDGRASRSARSLNAHAYTLGRHIIFGDGQYSPGTFVGKMLLAHELTHITQHDAHPGAHVAVLRQPSAPGGPSGRCKGLLEYIKELVSQLKDRIAEALLDRYDLFKYHRSISDAHPDYGSWEGHSRKFTEVQEELRRQRTNWLLDNCDDDDIDGAPPLLVEAYEYAHNTGYPAQPEPRRQPSSSRALEPEETGVPTWVWVLLGAALTAALIACFASGVCELGAIVAGLGTAARFAIVWALRAAGVTIVASGSVASNSQSPQARGLTPLEGPDENRSSMA